MFYLFIFILLRLKYFRGKYYFYLIDEIRNLKLD